MTLSAHFAEYALGHADFDDASIKASKTFILDSTGVGIAGARAPFANAVFETVMQWGQGGESYVFGRDIQLPVGSVAYLNGFQIHSMEYDCVHEPAVVHPMATIWGALSAEAQAHIGLSGRELLEAVIVAVDVAVELGVAATTGLKFFRPATAGLFGATLGIARLRGFDRETALSAMGCALAQCAGVMQAHVEGKPTLPVQIAGAARAAVVACDLAQAGLHGPVQALEGEYGYFAMFEDAADLQAASERLGKVHRITEVSWKPFPTGRAGQGGIVAVQGVLKQGVKADDIVSLELSAPPIIPRLVARPAKAGMTPNYARLCFQYLGAVTLKYGTVGLDDFTPDMLSDPELLDLAEKIAVTTNTVTDPAEFVPQTAIAVLKTGEAVTETITHLFGSPEFPLTQEQHLQKFHKCLQFGLRHINAENTAIRLIGLVDQLDTLPDCGELFALAAGSKG